MFLQSLVMDPEEERRRRLRRARIVRRNRIKREVALGLPVRIHRAPRPTTPAFDAADFSGDLVDWNDQYAAPTSPFRPTFGGNGDDARPPRSDMIHVSQFRPKQFVPAKSAAKPRAKHKAESPPTPSTVDLTGKTAESSDGAIPTRPLIPTAPSPAPRPTFTTNTRQMNPQVLRRWHEAVDNVLVRRHEEILSKDSDRKWRQERFGLRLFARGEYEKAARHLSMAVSLGASSGTCWRRLAQCHWRRWGQSGDWTTLWDCRGAYEQGLTHVEVACSPFALFEYARTLEALGDYSDALSMCAAILSTFPTFQQRKQVVLRYVLLQRYQLFSGASTRRGDEQTQQADGSRVASIDQHTALLKCIGYTKELLLDQATSKGEQCIEVLYMHARLNELLVVESGGTSAGVTAISKASTTVALATATADRCFDELLRAAVQRQILSSKVAPGRKPWWSRCETYTAFAQYFQSRNEPIPASDALARALELLDEPEPKIKAPTTPVTFNEQQRKRIELYVVLGRTYYQSNQMEKAIRAMEAVFDMDPLHQEARASLAKWFPGKWECRLDLEDASQVQIARVLRGIWGRNRASRLREAVEQRAERRLRDLPYDPSARRLVLRLLRDKYAPVFAAQEISVRIIQQQARKFLHFAHLRLVDDERRAKVVKDLLSKYRTRKYRYNPRVRAQLAQLLPREFEARFEREEAACRLIQRRFRGYRVRGAYVIRRDAHRAEVARVRLAAERIQRFLCWCVDRRHREQLDHARSMHELLLEAQRRVAHAKERVARGLQTCYRRRQHRLSSNDMASFVVDQSRASGITKSKSYRSKCAMRVQHAWKRYLDAQQYSSRTGSNVANLVEVVRPGTGNAAARRSIETHRDHAARKIQAQYRRKTIRESLGQLKRVPAAPIPSVIHSLVAKIDENYRRGVETRALLSCLETIEQRRALFECPVVVIRGERRRPSTMALPHEAKPEVESGSNTPPAAFTRHLANAIQFSVCLRCLICESGDFGSYGIVEVMKAVGLGKSLRVLGFGAIDTGSGLSEASRTQPIDITVSRGRPAVASAIQTLSKAVRTANFLLEELYLEDNDLLSDAREGALLAEMVGDFFFARYGHLHTLVVARMRLSDANAELLAAALSINTALRHLDLHGNRLGDATASAFATRGLPFNSALRYLNLADNAVGSPGASALFQCLEKANHALETLVLTNNNVQNDAVGSLRSAWQANAVLRSVELAGNLVHTDHLRQLAAAADERRAVAPSSAELRLFLARKRFASEYATAPLSPSSPLKCSKSNNRSGSGKKHRAREVVALSPHRWLQQGADADAQALASPIRSPAAAYKWQRMQQQPSLRSHRQGGGGADSIGGGGNALKLRKGDGSNVARRTKLPALD